MMQLACFFDGGLCIIAGYGLIGVVTTILGWLGFKRFRKSAKPDCANHDH